MLASGRQEGYPGREEEEMSQDQQLEGNENLCSAQRGRFSWVSTICSLSLATLWTAMCLNTNTHD